MSRAGDDYLADANLAPLWRAAHAAWCRNGGLRGQAIMRDLSERESLAIAGLMWRSPPWPAGATARVSLPALQDRLVQAQLADELAPVLERLVGPLRDDRSLRAERQQRLTEGWQSLQRHPALTRHAQLDGWLDELRLQGTATRLAKRAGRDPFTLVADALDVVAVLPCEPPEGLPTFAARVAGHTHALDQGRPLDALVCSALAWRDGVDRPRDAESRRGLYDRFGVVCDALSNTVLCAGLRPSGSGLAAVKLRLSAEAGAPCVLTLAEIRQLGRLHGVGAQVSVCENPEVMASALERFGANCPPLVCISGWPHVAALRLLRALSAEGCALRYHGDFDWDGLRIAAAMIVRLDVALWRYDASSYMDAPSGPTLGAERGSPQLPEPLQLLRERMRSRGVAVAEEQVLDELLDDLARLAGG